MARQPLGGLERLIVRGFKITLLRHNTFGRTPLDERSSLPRDLYLTIHNTYKRQTSMPSAGFEPAIPVSEPPQTHTLDRTATGIGRGYVYAYIIHSAHSLCHTSKTNNDGGNSQIQICSNEEGRMESLPRCP